jgi:hypothetical protein
LKTSDGRACLFETRGIDRQARRCATSAKLLIDAADLGGACNQNFFKYRAGVVAGDLKDLFRIGRRSLSIGILSRRPQMAESYLVTARSCSGAHCYSYARGDFFPVA